MKNSGRKNRTFLNFLAERIVATPLKSKLKRLYHLYLLITDLLFPAINSEFPEEYKRRSLEPKKNLQIVLYQTSNLICKSKNENSKRKTKMGYSKEVWFTIQPVILDFTPFWATCGFLKWRALKKKESVVA